MNKFKERFQKGKVEIIMGIILFLIGIIITFFMYDRNAIQSSGLYTLMFAPIISGAFFIIMGFFKK
jgi:hypothetical protein